jgi:adhesin transport system outer membrane protein
VVTVPPNLAAALPANVEDAVGQARTEHPLVREAIA